MIEAKHGKSILKYSHFPKEDEILLRLGTRVCVKSDPLKHAALNVIELMEIQDESSDDVPSTLAVPHVNKPDGSVARKYPSTREGLFLIGYPDLSNNYRATKLCL